MPAKAPSTTDQGIFELQALGEQIRVRRKAPKVSATVAVGMSRVTLHRIEKGESSVAMGAWANAIAVLGMALHARPTDKTNAPARSVGQKADLANWIPVRVRLADYPHLKALASQMHGTDALSPTEALGIYERNARHLDPTAMQPEEQALWQALRTGLGDNGKPGRPPDGV